MGGFKHTGVGSATARTMYPSAAQIQDNGLVYAATSGTDTYTATLMPAITAYVTGAEYCLDFGNANTSTTPTVNLNSIAAKTLVRPDGSALIAGDVNGTHTLRYDGTSLRVLNPKKIAVANVVGATSGTVTSVSDDTNGGINVTNGTTTPTLSLKPSDLSTKAIPTTSDSVIVMDAAASNAAKTSTVTALAATVKTAIGGTLFSAIKSFTRDLTAASGDVAYTGVGFIPTSIIILGSNGGGQGSWGFADSTKSGLAIGQDNSGSMYDGSTTAISIQSSAGATGQTAVVKTYDADGFTLTWTKIGSPSGTAVFKALCLK